MYFIALILAHDTILFSFTLQAAYKEWGSFQLYHNLFFKNQSWGPGGNNADTASADEEEDAATPAMATTPATPGPSTKQKRPADSDDSDVEPGKKPCRETTRKRSNMTNLELYTAMQENMAELEEQREERRMAFERKQEEERQKWEEKREQERQEREDRLERERIEREERRERRQEELDDKRIREQREYEEKREKERAEAAAAVRQSEREFNAQLLVKLFAKNE